MVSILMPGKPHLNVCNVSIDPGFGPGFGSGPGMPGWPRPRSGFRISGIGGLIAAVIMLMIAGVVAISIASHGPSVSPSGPCLGGPAPGAAGQDVGHGNFKFDCVDGGTTIVHLGNGPGGN